MPINDGESVLSTATSKMTTTRNNPVVFYAPVPSGPEADFSPGRDYGNYVILPLYPRRQRRRPSHLCRYLSISAALFLLAAAAYLLYPSDPTLTLTRLQLNNINVSASPTPSLSLSLSVSLRVFNPDFFSVRFSSLAASVGYRGQKLGHVTSDGGHVRARGTSYVNATLELDGFEIIHDFVYLIEDLTKGLIPLETDSVVKGTIRLFLLELPIKARVWCEVYVNTSNQTIIRQDCYPK